MWRGPWFKREDPGLCVTAGAVFQHRIAAGLMETARVIGVGPDLMGIPHVTYLALVQGSAADRYEERRTLNLETFARRFGKSAR